MRHHMGKMCLKLRILWVFFEIGYLQMNQKFDIIAK